MEPQIVYRIAWHISDPETWFNFALVCKRFAAAVKYWEKPKMTEFSIAFGDRHILPNGVFHGPHTYADQGFYIYKGLWLKDHSGGRYSFLCGDYSIVCYGFKYQDRKASMRIKIRNIFDDSIDVTLCKCGGFNYEIIVGARMTLGGHECIL